MKWGKKTDNALTVVIILLLVLALLPVLYGAGRIFVCDRFITKGESMEPTMHTGEPMYVKKWIMGARIYTKFDFTTDELHCFRMPGFRKLRVGDIAVFNYPFGWKNREIGFKINYVYAKRCVGAPGDTLTIVDSHYINSSHGESGIPKECESYLRALPDSLLLQSKSLRAGQFAGEHREWTIKDMGPLVVPGRNVTVVLDSVAMRHYALVLEYENDDLDINALYGTEYRFKENYYFFAGDNVANSRDSRYFGFVPEDFVVGVI